MMLPPVVIAALAAITLGVLALLLVPLLRRNRHETSRDQHSLEVFRDQLAELERDAARGVLGQHEAATAKHEIERRILALDLGAAEEPTMAKPTNARLTALALVVLVPLAAILVYSFYGSPDMPDQPIAERWADDRQIAEGGPTVGDVRRMITRLEQDLAETPDRVDAWATLAGAYALLEQYDQAAIAMGRATQIEPGNAEHQSLHGEFLVLAAGGIVTPAATDAFEAARAAEPDEPVARFYLALARAQSDDVAGALADWQTLLADSPPGAPWTPMVTEQIIRAAGELGIDPDQALSQQAGPSQDDVDAITSLPDDEQVAMIRGMVEGLAARLEDEPDDLEGWTQLARSYSVLGEWALARTAYKHALGLAPEDRAIADDFANAVSGSLPQDETVPADAVQDYADVLAVNPQNEQALYYSGLAAKQAGDNARAIDLWSQLRDQLVEGSRERLFIDEKLGEIDGNG